MANQSFLHGDLVLLNDDPEPYVFKGKIPGKAFITRDTTSFIPRCKEVNPDHLKAYIPKQS